jgi:hypothetical protein
VRVLSDGRALVNDATGRRIVLLDASLKGATIVADETGSRTKYGSRASSVIPFLGDSTLFVDFDARALVVIEPAGRFGRAMALPLLRPDDIFYLLNSTSAGLDPKGRLVYLGGRPRPRPAPGTPPEPRAAADGANRAVVAATVADSGSVIGANFDTRVVDTLAAIRLPVFKRVQVSRRPTMTEGANAFNPLPITDDWALMPDGTIAIVRAQDYHVDWVTPDGKMSSTPRMPFDWKRITTEEKQALLDSLAKAESARRALVPPPLPGVLPPLPFVLVDAADIGDFYPPIRAGQMKASPDGKLWILPSTSLHATGELVGASAATVAGAGSGLVYDVVNRNGQIEERVKLPQGRTLAGFGRDGTLYLAYAPHPALAIVERARIVR